MTDLEIISLNFIEELIYDISVIKNKTAKRTALKYTGYFISRLEKWTFDYEKQIPLFKLLEILRERNREIGGGDFYDESIELIEKTLEKYDQD